MKILMEMTMMPKGVEITEGDPGGVSPSELLWQQRSVSLFLGF
jgi:hypothetical protein